MEWVKRAQPLSDKEIIDLENQLGVRLPLDFVRWFKQYEDPKSNHVVIDIDVNDEQENLDDQYDVDEFYSLEDMVSETDSFFKEDEELKAKGVVVPFAFTTTLDQYCFFYPRGSKEPSGVFIRPRDYDISDIFKGNGIKEALYLSQTSQGFLDQLFIDDFWNE
ncbi:SMI1/KNR4 family protein [Desmospora profundinema]|uniref:Knr4/Smi1-like domain-containing protein n=1 Tax=Desmospora profundinema TaxID=1571184 RepID=A0ABU1IJ19_9BACL|nr:SMI1/KNR4 family protein [Desmospora profundinema]MDR6224758.1 hypothetical protein [Desmospora profundinema]